ncbi:TetR family transcriptional regulator [Nocardioides sp. BGMRC 2183]|nr:TetR family transcriptional regulator [Nocardioides sp. BGMRC 2183]
MARPSVEAERRDQIMRSACKVIATRGVLGLRVSDVARDAGVSPGIVHYYFDSKLELIRAAFENNFDRSLDRRAVIFDNRSDHAVEVLTALVDSYSPVDEETIEAWHVWIELWAAALQDDELKLVHDRAYSRWAERIEGLIIAGQARGELAPGDSTALAHHLMGLLDGLSVQALLGSHGMTATKVQSICASLIASMREPVEAV